MGKITVAMYLTLDGVMEMPSWTSPYWEQELSDYQEYAMKHATALLLGRRTFQEFAAAWPESPDEGAPFMNGIEKFVPTTTLSEEYWKAHFLKYDIEKLIRALRDQNNLLVYGSAQLVRYLFAHDLVDEYREMVFPLILGKGKRLFENDGKPYKFSKLESSRTLRNVLLNTYSV
jgi:dihydrofolate reductase